MVEYITFKKRIEFSFFKIDAKISCGFPDFTTTYIDKAAVPVSITCINRSNALIDPKEYW